MESKKPKHEKPNFDEEADYIPTFVVLFITIIIIIYS